MTAGDDILISLERRHADNIFSGFKRVELRRRSMQVSPSTTVWIYVKLPVGSVMGRAKVESIHALAPATLWRKFGKISGLSRGEFFEYFDGLEKGVALVLVEAEELKTPISLKDMRELSTGFQPPQFFIRLGNDTPVLHEMRSRALADAALALSDAC
ncbi:MAG: hypothetical protein Q8J78_11490 [Moraxellaceae bacterium]|nr:hypothetical protein [Moraxellaceae bacterium]